MTTRTRFEMSQKLTSLIGVAGFRAVRGAELVATGQVRHLAGPLWLVKGSNGEPYIVDLAAGSCDCPDGRAPHDAQGRKWCKHVCAVVLAAGK